MIFHFHWHLKNWRPKLGGRIGNLKIFCMMHIYKMAVITIHNEVAKVMFLQVSVWPQGRWGCMPQCMLGYHPSRADTPPWEQIPYPRADTPWSRHPLGSRHPPWADTPLGADTTQEHTPIRSRHPLPLGSRPPRSRHPQEQTPAHQSRHPMGADTP